MDIRLELKCNKSTSADDGFINLEILYLEYTSDAVIYVMAIHTRNIIIFVETTVLLFSVIQLFV